MQRSEDLAAWARERLSGLQLDLGAPVDPVQRVVLGIDGSEDALAAAQWAAQLAQEVHTVYADHRGYAGGSSSPSVMESLAEDARFAFSLVEDGLEEVAVKQHTMDASPARAIVAVARSVEADLICVGSRSHAVTDTPGLGSVSETLVHHAPFPVLLAHDTPGRGPVMVAVGQDRSTVDAVRWAIAVAAALEAPIELLHSAPDELERIDLDTFAQDAPALEASASLIGWPPRDGLTRAVRNHVPALLVAGHGRHRHWLGSTALALLRDRLAPTLVVPWGEPPGTQDAP